MSLLSKIILSLLSIISFSCKTRLEKQGWQRIPIVSQLDTSTLNKKDKEIVVVKIENLLHSDSTGKIIKKPFLARDQPSYVFNVFVKDSTGKIINDPFPVITDAFKSDLAYYKWESDSICLVKVLNQGNVQASYKLSYFHNSRIFSVLDEPKK